MSATSVVTDALALVTACRQAAGGSEIVLGRNVSASGPVVFGADNVTLRAAPGTRPKVTVPHGTAVFLSGRQGITLRGIDFAADQPTPMTAGLAARDCSRLTVEDCGFSGFCFGVTIEGGEFLADQPLARARSRSVAVRRCRVWDNYNPGTDPAHLDSSGLYASDVDGLEISGCVFDRNGWGDKAPARDRNQGVYVAGNCGPATIAGNAFLRSANCNLQARSGGDVTGNLFTDAPIGLTYGYVSGAGPMSPGGVTGRVAGNAVIGSRDLNGVPGGIGLILGNIGYKVAVLGNLFADAPDAAYPAVQVVPCTPQKDNQYVTTASRWGKPVGVQDLTIKGNAVHNWHGGTYRLAAAPPEQPVMRLDVQADWAPAHVPALGFRRLFDKAGDDKIFQGFRTHGVRWLADILRDLFAAAGMR